MATIKGYKWTTKEAAEAAQISVDNYVGFPKEGSQTLHYFGFELGINADNTGEPFYYAVADKTMESVLGSASNIQIYTPFDNG